MHSSADAHRPQPLFQSGDRICNNSARRHGVIAEEPCLWAGPVPLPNGEQRPGHWTYAVAWDGQMGLTIRSPRICFVRRSKTDRSTEGPW